jgi:competence protein ComEC
MTTRPDGTSERPRDVPNYHPLMLVVCALAVGIVVDRYAPLSAPVWWLLSLAALLGWCAVLIIERHRLASFLLLICVLAAGGAGHHGYWRLYRADEISRMVREGSGPVCVEAIAITSPRWVPEPPPTALRTIPQGERSELVVWVTAIRDGQKMRTASGWADLDVGGLVERVRAGDRLRIMAQGGRPMEPLNPGDFDFANYQRTRRVGCRLFAEFPDSVERLKRGSPWSPRRWLADARSSGSAILRRYIAPKRATLASAVLLGAREQLDPHRNEDYLVTGTIHVLSISGLHVGILAAGFFLVLHSGLVPRRITLVATIVLTICYALLTDLQPPVVRASILVIVGCVAMWTGRSAIGFNTLAAAGIFVLMLNPASLFLTGTQLSFMAVATMIAFQPLLIRQPIVDPLDRLIATTRPWLVRTTWYTGDVLWRLWLTGALIWLVSTPLVWKQYHLISPVALVLNFLMWLPVTVAMYSGMGTLLFGSVAPIVGRICGAACDGALDVLERLIVWGRDWPASHWWLASPPGWWIGVFYIVLGLVCVFPSLRARRRSRLLAGLALFWIAGAVVLSGLADFALPYRPARPLACHFLAVGHGVGVLVELPDGQNLLYDSGHLGSPQGGVRPVAAVLWSRGIRRLDAIIISHADADHFNAIPGLLERFQVGKIYVSPVMFRRTPPAVEELRRAIDRSGVPAQTLYSGQRLPAANGTKVEALHPPEKGVFGSDNANSIVLLIEHAERRVLLTGDLETTGLEELLASEACDADLVLAPHHGSPRSNPGRFSDWCRPEVVVISGRRSLGDEAAVESVKNSFRLRGAEVFHTAEDGCVSAVIRQQGVNISTFRPHVRAMPAEASANLLQSE